MKLPISFNSSNIVSDDWLYKLLIQKMLNIDSVINI